MKQLYSVKRVVHLCTALLFLFILSTVIYSCRKELKMVPLSAADSVDAARSWYESIYPVNNLVGVNNKTTTLGVNSIGSTAFDYSQYIKPDWNHAGKYKRFGKDVIEMPVDASCLLYYGLKNANTGQQISAKENSRAWFLLLNDGKAYNAYVMVLIGDPGYINGDPSKISNNSYRKRDANFSGLLLYFTPKGKLINCYKYQNGSLDNGNTAATATQQTQNVKKVNVAAPVTDGCIDWYWTTWDQYGTVVGESYLYTTCNGGGGGPTQSCTVNTNSVTQKIVNVAQTPPGDSGPPDNSNDGAGGNDSNIPYPNDPGYPDPSQGQGSTCSAPTITNNVTGCNGAVINTLITGNLTGNVASIINLFNTSSTANINFVESTNTNGAPALTVVTSNPNSSVLNIEIRINTTVLPSDASEDYKASIILHEIIHGYLDYKGIDLNSQLAQHADIANGYVAGMASILSQAFGTNAENAAALAFGGIADFATSYPNQYNQLLAAQNISESTRSFDTELQRAGLSGTVCK